MKPTLNLSINPSYYCNFRCPFCYLTTDQLSDKSRLDLRVLEIKLEEVSKEYGIGMVDIYGGETLMLPREYLDELIEMVRRYEPEDINIITNLSVDSPFLNDDRVYLTVSYDFDSREKSEEVFSRMMLLEKPFSILMLCDPKLPLRDIDSLIEHFNLLTNLVSVEIKPYSSNQANQLAVYDVNFEEVVKRFIVSDVKKRFIFINELNIQDSLSGERNAFSNDHLYITPKGEYAVLEFDDRNNEFFLSLDTLNDYRRWCDVERERVNNNPICGSCEYKGNCLSEHLRTVTDLEGSCNGFKSLLDWYKETRC